MEDIELVAFSWISKKTIPEEFFDDDPNLYEVILQMDKEVEKKALYIDRNIIIHGDNLYEGLFKLDHFEKIKDKIKEIEEKADGDSL
jgi:hypothetical protein